METTDREINNVIPFPVKSTKKGCARCDWKGYVEHSIFHSNNTQKQISICPHCKDEKAYSDFIKSRYANVPTAKDGAEYIKYIKDEYAAKTITENNAAKVNSEAVMSIQQHLESFTESYQEDEGTRIQRFNGLISMVLQFAHINGLYVTVENNILKAKALPKTT